MMRFSPEKNRIGILVVNQGYCIFLPNNDIRILIKKYYSDEDFSSCSELLPGEYENCTFSGCNLSNANLSGITFSECSFSHCDLSMAIIKDTGFKDVKFSHCKLMGLHFDVCNPFLLSMQFHHSILTFSSFYKLNLKFTPFIHCNLEEVDFSDVNLTAAVFDNCELSRAIFENTDLHKADFRTSQNFIIDPDLNKISKARFSSHNILGLLAKYDIDVE